MIRTSRRAFVKAAGLGVVAAAVPAGARGMANEESSGNGITGSEVGFTLGMASYTFREFGLDETLKMTSRLGLTKIAFKNFHLALDATRTEIEEVVDRVRTAGLDLYGGGVIYMRNEQEVDQAFDYAQYAGMRVIIGVPNHELLPLVERKVQQYDIQLAIHNHGPGDQVYPTPESAYELVKDLDPRMGLCIDVGHTQRAGVDPSESVERFFDRLHDVHMKDVSAASREGGTVEVGRGVIDVPKLLSTLVRLDYRGVVAFEHEKDGNDPLAGAAESVGFTRGVMATL
ncbi:sugar phosphate isomerase/epimerase family protein [Candidatus Zixiibacteriota bacterium]